MREVHDEDCRRNLASLVTNKIHWNFEELNQPFAQSNLTFKRFKKGWRIPELPASNRIS